MENNHAASPLSSDLHLEDNKIQPIKQIADTQVSDSDYQKTWGNNPDTLGDSSLILDKDDSIVVSFFKSVTSKGQSSTLDAVLEKIKDGHYKKAISKLRYAKDHGDDALAGKIKNSLPAFTPSGEFNKTHRKEDLIRYNPIVILDIDKVGNEKAVELKDKVKTLDTVYASFISPSGDGLKLIVKTDSTSENHEDAFNQVVAFFENELQVKIDISGKDFSRLCFLSYDTDLYINEGAFIFKTTNKTPEVISDNVTFSGDISELFAHTVNFTEKIRKFQPGDRNNFIFLLSNNLNRIGLDKTTTESLIRTTYTDPDISREIAASVNSAYSHVSEHGIWTPEYVVSVSSVSSVTVVKQETNIGTPLIPDLVYDNLPDLLKKCVQVFLVPREKDIMLLGSITILSGIFPTVKGIYDRREYYPNLFSFIIAPPASGKGILVYAKALAQRIHDSNIQEFEDSDGNWDVPSQRSHFIPADSSAAAVKGILRLNNGLGTICETEAETLSSTFQQDWGNYVQLICKGFQHESIDFGRKGEKHSVRLEEIQCPKLTMLLSGTPNQIPALINGIDDGLFSRFLFYSFRNTGTPFFKNVFSEGGITNLNEYFKQISNEVFDEYYVKSKNIDTILFTLTKDQQNEFVAWFDKMVKRTHLLFGDETDSIVLRLGLITFRIMTTLTIIRNAGKGELKEKMECDNIDFTSSLILSDIYLEHALAVYQLLPNNKTINRTATSFYEVLPGTFTYSEALTIGELLLNIKSKSVSSYLRDMKEAGMLSQPKQNGPYFKTYIQ